MQIIPIPMPDYFTASIIMALAEPEVNKSETV